MSDSVFKCLILNHLNAQYLTYKYLSHIYVYLLNIIELEQTGHMNYSSNSLILGSNCRQMTITKTFYIELRHDIIYAHIMYSFYSTLIGYLDFSRIFIIFTSFASFLCEFINWRKTCWNTWNEIFLNGSETLVQTYRNGNLSQQFVPWGMYHDKKLRNQEYTGLDRLL